MPQAVSTLTNSPIDEVEVRNERRHVIRYINLKLAALGLPIFQKSNRDFLDLTEGLLRNYQEKTRLLSNYLCPVDARIQSYLDKYLKDVDQNVPARLPSRTFVLDRPGLARELSIPADSDSFFNDIISSFRVKQGVLHNPKNDRRTTKGVFHVTEGGLPVPLDKRAAPKQAFAKMLAKAFQPPADLLRLPFLANQVDQAETFVSLLLRPIVCPEVPGHSPQKTMEVRFFAPGSMVSNLDFVESIFGNAGDPSLAENDAALDVEHWTGTTGCVILAPHLTRLTKKELGLPHVDNATERQRREGMCWADETELYNDGQAFKLTCRTDEGIMVTIIADNYFGYCKKEVKTQISYSANLIGGCEEEHAGGALAFPSYHLGDQFRVDSMISRAGHTFAEVIENYGSMMDLHPEGYGTDKEWPDIVYVPEDVSIDLTRQEVCWEYGGKPQSIKLLPGRTYVHPAGYKVHMEKHPGAPSWRLVGTVAEGTFCHKPCTVSGGGKSEISKSILDAVHYGPFFIANLNSDFELVEEIINRDYSDRFRVKRMEKSRSLLSMDRSLGSVIKLLTPSSSMFTDEYNKWVCSIPDYIKAMVFIIKRFYHPDWEGDWRKYFSADNINGMPGHELKFNGRKLVASYLRVGLESSGAWRTFKLRQDFVPAQKIQTEDDISASVVVPSGQLEHLNPLDEFHSLKLIKNCERRLFQRPDEAINRGFDKQTEQDLSEPNNFISNFEPLTPGDARMLIEDSIGFHQYTEPMQELIREAAKMPEGSYFCSSSHPRIVDGKPTKNPRYLQLRPDIANPRSKYLAEISTRLRRRVPMDKQVLYPVNSVLAGRRNNPPDYKAGIRPLAVYNPIHYQELPELFMDFVCSLTGKSPSTTGAGSEGALTKGPFNALTPTSDLNDALVSFILTGYQGFTSCAGYVGPKYRVDHDISLLIPEVWCRLSNKERNAEFLIAEGCLEKVEDFDHNGQKVLGSRLGYRMTKSFLRMFFGRVFDSPMTLFNDEMLRPETQDMESYVDGINNIVEAQQRVAKAYLDDGSVESACPPLKALIHIMATGSYEGKDASDPKIRQMFTREYLLASDWYRERLEIKQQRDENLWKRHIRNLEQFLALPSHSEEAERLSIVDRLENARRQLNRIQSPEYLESLRGTTGADPLHRG